MRRLQAFFLGAVLSLVAVPLCVGSDVDSLRINVTLRDDGSATVTETWRIDVSSEISEWYLVAGNMGRMTISDLQVRDETGKEYYNEGEWDVNRSRARKAGRCGLVTKPDGYEICWGVGSSGLHTYTVSYLMTGLVKGYEEMDGFNQMFVARDLGSSPQSVILTIRKPGFEFTTDNTKVWAFGFRGEIHVEDGAVVARSSEPFVKKSALIALVGFEKGIFQPALVEDKTFDEVRQRAMEGSDYRAPEDEDSGDLWLGLLFGLGVILTVFGSVKVISKTVKRKRELLGGRMKDVQWFRDAPLGGDLKRSADILCSFSGNTMQERERLIAAYITRLFYRGAFEVVPQPGQSKPAMRIKDLVISEEGSSDTALEAELYSFIKAAAGGDGILQKNELKRWAESNGKALYKWGKKAFPDGVTIWTIEPDETRQVFGLRKYLKDFTLIKDRGVVEVKLWNNYLVFAALYGIADQLIKDFRKVCPEYFNLSSAAELLEDNTTNMVIWSMINMTSRNFNTAAVTYEASLSGNSGSSWSGGGGMSSWGGGGGFSGGGSGGGGR